MDITAIKTEAYLDQTFGTSGLRRHTSVFMQKNYVHNAVQSIFDSLEGFEGKTLVVGGDGRYFNDKAIQIVLKIAAANGFGRLIVGKNGWLSTPALSHLISLNKAFGGIILTASHNPGGKNGDFGIKFNIASGAPAPLSLTDKILAHTKTITRYWWVDEPDVNLRHTGTQHIGQTLVEVVDPVADYVKYMQQIFDFPAIQRLFRSGFKMVFDAMNAITGPYAKYIFEDVLKASKGSVINAKPLPDFGGTPPDPNLSHAKGLVEKMNAVDGPDFGAASDGDGDRYMIMGRHFFVNPSDSLALLAEYLPELHHYNKHFYGVARSLPTSCAVDFVAKRKNYPVFMTPTGWKFFGNLLENKRISLCGEESFGAGSFHVLEKDGLWAVLAWLNIIAITGKMPEQLLTELWQKDGRVYYMRHNYENIETEKVTALMQALKTKLPRLRKRKFGCFEVKSAQVFEYEDPVTHEIAKNQGVIITMSDEATICVRVSGTGTEGATLRLYFSRHDDKIDASTEEMLAPVILATSSLLEIEKHLNISGPTSVV